MASPLYAYYEYVGPLQGLTGLVSKVCLGAILAAVAMGNEKPGQRLLTAVVGVEFLLAAYVTVSFIGDPVYAKLRSAVTVPLIAIVCFVLGVSWLINAAKMEGRWTAWPRKHWKRAVAGLLYAWAFYYPVFTDGWLRPVLMSPGAALPQPILLAGGTLVWLSMPNAPRLAAWATAIALIVVGLADIALAGVGSSLILLLLSGMIGVQILASSREGGLLGDQVPPVDLERRSRLKELQKERTEPERRWKLK